jgi:NAD(P)H-dependent FMN reductase
MTMRVLALCGSLRQASFNRLLLNEAVAVLRPKAEVDLLDLLEVAMPIFDADLEARDGLPDGARRLRERIAAAPAIVIATPEYNNSVPGGLKNAIDWVSRPPDQPLKGKTALLLSASPGQFGGVRSLMALRPILTTLMAVVVPSTVSIPFADKAFDEKGSLKEPRQRSQVERACAELLRFAAALSA